MGLDVEDMGVVVEMMMLIVVAAEVILWVVDVIGVEWK